jgi:hypothetical protein
MAENLYLGPILCEEHWLQSGNPEEMEQFLGERGSKRRWQLFACACCWRILPLLEDEASRRAVSVAERRAEGDVGADEVHEALEDARTATLRSSLRSSLTAPAFAAMAAEYALSLPRRAYLHSARATGGNQLAEHVAQCGLLRELFGNPFRPFLIDAAWRTPLVLTIAAGIYERELYDEMPVLGDALEDAGCDVEQVLAHCRSGTTHVRGCWALDALLGKD